ncbi:MAG TPA: DUF2066 domain-containing protein [Steroidobacteraceae bacterium]|nr:DUF2066 domain-containing protein [Steroidobacteraceae bacterium]
MNLPHRSPRELIRKDRWTALCLIAVLGVVEVAPAWALRPVQVYQVTVRGASAASVVADGMREALVRATGRRDAAANPLLAGVVENAGQYLKGSRSLAGGAVQLDFDAARLGQAITAAGASLWDSNRPFTLVAISPVPSGPAGDALRIQLEQTAEGRGLPISLVPLAVADATGVPLPDDVVLQSAQALGGDAVLIGRADPANPGQWQWHLVSSYTSEGWTGDSDVGVNGAADSLASVAINSGSKVLVQVAVQIAGVASLTDYARVEQLLRALPGVQSSGLTAAQGTTANFTVGMRGGGEALVRALTGSPHLGAAATGETQVQLNYTP